MLTVLRIFKKKKIAITFAKHCMYANCKIKKDRQRDQKRGGWD